MSTGVALLWLLLLAATVEVGQQRNSGNGGNGGNGGCSAGATAH